MPRSLCLSFLLCLSSWRIVSSEIIYVPTDFQKIQSAIDSCADFDTIIVSEGVYAENLNFRGRKAVLASLYILDGETSHILNTVIDGGQPLCEDTGSCVLFACGEDSNSVIQGFTITNGSGTKWTDEHGHGIYIEGGGILVSNSSPKIMDNLIVYNRAIRTASGIISSGAGGIRVGDGFPLIQNNVIIGNSGMYGGGIVLNYSGGIIRNNIIAKNRVFRPYPQHNTYGGGGIWIGNDNPSYPIIVENNVIIGNSALGDGSLPPCGKGGGVLIHSTSVELRNNILWRNTATYPEYNQIWTYNAGTTAFTYCDIEGGWSGTGNISTNPLFCDSNYVLSFDSPCVDSGDPMSSNDPEDTLNPGNALYPSRGFLRNDIGVYGGQFSKSFPDITQYTQVEEENPGTTPINGQKILMAPLYYENSVLLRFFLEKQQYVVISVYSVNGSHIGKIAEGEFSSGLHQIHLNNYLENSAVVSSGIYFLKLFAGERSESVSFSFFSD
ncbi:hypothetical protein JXA84_01200 [candidate division WOR-3 bacterium]|nr:hypothetical protein [candidate division WOR-3 bacterium]